MATTKQSKKAKPGQTAVRREVEVANPLAQLVPGAPPTTKVVCGFCEADLSDFARRQRTAPSAITYCPSCQVKLEEPKRTYCYSCSTPLADTGNCTTCRSSSRDAVELKAAIVKLRLEQPSITDPKIRKATARGLLADEVDKAELLEEARSRRWVEAVEEGTLLPFASAVGEPTRASIAPPVSPTASAPPTAGGLRLRSSVEVSGPVYAELSAAILCAYRSWNELDMMLSDETGTRLNLIAAQGPLGQVVFEVIGHFKAHGAIDQLVAGARRSNPGNPQLRAWVDKYMTT